MHSRVFDQPAFILHRRDFQNSSLILELLTRDYGRISVVVKAAKKRRDRSCFEYCTRLSVGWTGTGELKTLTHIDSHTISMDGTSTLCVFYINELLLYLLPKQDSHLDIFERYQMFVLELAHEKPDQINLEILLRNFEMNLLKELGIMPALDIESELEISVQPDLLYKYDPVKGVTRDLSVRGERIRGDILIAIQQRDFQHENALSYAKGLLRQIIDYNLQGRALQSRKLYKQLNYPQ